MGASLPLGRGDLWQPSFPIYPPNLGTWSREGVRVCITDPGRSSPEMRLEPCPPCPAFWPASPWLSPKLFLGPLVLATSDNGQEIPAWEASLSCIHRPGIPRGLAGP